MGARVSLVTLTQKSSPVSAFRGVSLKTFLFSLPTMPVSLVNTHVQSAELWLARVPVTLLPPSRLPGSDTLPTLLKV